MPREVARLKLLEGGLAPVVYIGESEEFSRYVLRESLGGYKKKCPAGFARLRLLEGGFAPVVYIGET